MKTCPICKARCFDDMEICYGCMYNFTHVKAPGLLPAEPPQTQPDKRDSSYLNFPPPHEDERYVPRDEAGGLGNKPDPIEAKHEKGRYAKEEKRNKSKGLKALEKINLQCQDGDVQENTAHIATFKGSLSDGDVIECQLCIRLEVLGGKAAS